MLAKPGYVFGCLGVAEVERVALGGPENFVGVVITIVHVTYCNKVV